MDRWTKYCLQVISWKADDIVAFVKTLQPVETAVISAFLTGSIIAQYNDDQTAEYIRIVNYFRNLFPVAKAAAVERGALTEDTFGIIPVKLAGEEGNTRPDYALAIADPDKIN